MEFISVFLTLFLIMDPFGNIPVFISVLEKVESQKRQKILIRELIFALIVIIGCILGGKQIISFMGLSQESISIAGGIILFLIAVKMIYPLRIFETKDDIESEPFLVPLAIPLIAGPSLMAVLLLFSSSESGHLLTIILAGSLAWVLTSIILFFSIYLLRYLGKKGLIAVERLMGMILVAISVQLFLDGISMYFKN
ncbi:MAG: NAAT family transporter [candidate division Zixibacteria bacterium]|nr:NAAT family transporter [candidate division Zixibacteria bacterium]